MAAREQFVFGYGSLASHGIGSPVRLEGYRRVWGVAMDNRMTIPGYKYYLRADGRRPEVFVAFLDIVAEAGAATDGVLFSFDDATLSALDRRERNYDRIDVTGAVSEARGTVWAYRGNSAGRERLRLGILDGAAVIDRGYRDGVRAGFAAAGIDDDLDPRGLPVVDLERVDLR